MAEDRTLKKELESSKRASLSINLSYYKTKFFFCNVAVYASGVSTMEKVVVSKEVKEWILEDTGKMRTVKNIDPPYLTCRRSLVNSNKTSRISKILRTRCGDYTLRS